MILKSIEIPADAEIEADVCVIGSGPASLSFASELLNSKIRVIILESGGLESDEGAEALCDGVIGSNPDFNPCSMRHRQFAGTSVDWNHRIGPYSRRCRFTPLDAIDFESREWLPFSGWPFSKSYLDPYYQRAQSLLGLGVYDYDGATWETPGRPRIPFRDETLQTTVFQFGDGERFNKDLREEMTRSENITVCLNATVVELETDGTTSSISRVRVANLAGGQFRVKARLYVLAAGGIENARLLLLSDRNAPGGLGNRHDNVGRYFNDHYMILGGFLIPSDRQIFDRMGFYDLHVVQDVPVHGKISPSDRLKRQEHLLNSATYLIPRHRTARIYAEAMDSLEKLRHGSRVNGIFPSSSDGPTARATMRHLWNVGKWPIHLANACYRRAIRKPFQHPWINAGGWSDLPEKPREFAAFEISHLVEQAPSPNNRVTLSSELDLLGCRKARVDCSFGDLDVRSIRRTQEILREEFARNGLGEFRPYLDRAPWNLSANGSAHHTGTTRMHEDPKLGVVDADCRVHDVSNLFIAGSSVFPTGGYANPTFTIIAMALRLADHLKTQLQP